MRKSKKVINAVFAVLLFADVFSLGGCGKKESDSAQENAEALKTIEEDEAADYYGGLEDYDDYIDSEDLGDGEDLDVGNGDVFRIDFEGDNSVLLNGKIESIIPADTSWVIAGTSEGSLFLLQPFIDYYLEDSEIKSYKITDDSHINDLVYANQHIAYGKNHIVYFDIIGEYEEPDEDMYELDSIALPEYVYTFENVQKADLADDQNLIFITNEADNYAYVDTDNRVCVGYKNSSSGGYATNSGVAFVEEDNERDDVVVGKSIFRFITTEDGELFYIQNINLFSDFGGNVQEGKISYVNLSDEIGVKVTGIYNIENDTDSCYAVDEEQNIYYVSVLTWEDEITVNKITQFEMGTITEIQGFAGESEKMLIRTEDGSYYYNDGYSDSAREIKSLDGTYKKAVLLMDENIIALGNDGYLYLIEN